MDRHLVAVEVRVECGTNERMQPDRTALDQHRLKCLNAETMQRRRTVQHDRMVLDDLFEHAKDLDCAALDHALCALDVLRETALDKLLHHERLEELQRHLLGQTALIHLQVRTDDDNRTARIVNTLAEQVLTETALLAAQHIGQRFQCAVAGARNRARTAAVVNQRIDRFLQHALFVANDDVRRAQLKQPFQTVVAVDDPAIQIVEVARRKPTAVELHHRAQFRRQHRQNGQNDPFGAVAAF